MATEKPKDKPRKKHAFVGIDGAGDPCIYICYIDDEGTTGDYLSQEKMQEVADKINRMRINP